MTTTKWKQILTDDVFIGNDETNINTTETSQHDIEFVDVDTDSENSSDFRDVDADTNTDWTVIDDIQSGNSNLIKTWANAFRAMLFTAILMAIWTLFIKTNSSITNIGTDTVNQIVSANTIKDIQEESPVDCSNKTKDTDWDMIPDHVERGCVDKQGTNNIAKEALAYDFRDVDADEDTIPGTSNFRDVDADKDHDLTNIFK